MDYQTSSAATEVSREVLDGNGSSSPQECRQMNATWSTIVMFLEYTLQRSYRL